MKIKRYCQVIASVLIASMFLGGCLPFAAAALIGKGDHRRAQGQVCRVGQQLHLVAGVDGATFFHPGPLS